MGYKHGVYVNEVPKAVTPSVFSATVPVVFGTAPVNLSKLTKPPINQPILCYTYAEAVEAFGYSDDWNFTLSEFIQSHFALFGASPAILVNVLDPETVKIVVPSKSVTLFKDTVTIEEQGILKSTVEVKSSDDATTYVLGTDYETNFDDKGNLVIQRLLTGSIAENATLKVNYDKLDPSKVTASDIIGGIDADGNPTGLELINQIFPRYRLVPSMILAPGFSHDPVVAAVMTAKAANINGNFKCIALTDIPSDQNYTDVPAWKEENSYTSPHQVNGYPLLTLGDKRYHLSTQLAGVLCVTDAENGNVPYMSPSNHHFKADGATLDDGTPVFLGPDQAAYLNGNGIVTALNFIGGWKAWGNRTGAYPSIADPKDAFIPVRRMMDWITNNIILAYWQRLDQPITRRLVEAVTDSLNLWLNGLTAQGFILGGRVEFQASENPTTDLMDGIVKFHVYVTPPSPAREIDFIVEYDAQYLSTLFA